MSQKDFSFESDPFEQIMEDKELHEAFIDGLMFHKGSEMMIKCSPYLAEAQNCFQSKVKKKRTKKNFKKKKKY